MKSPRRSLGLLGALMGALTFSMSSALGIRRHQPWRPTPPLPPSPDNAIGEETLLPPSRFDMERIQEAEDRRAVKAAKKALAVSRARGEHLEHRTIGS